MPAKTDNCVSHILVHNHKQYKYLFDGTYLINHTKVSIIEQEQINYTRLLKMSCQHQRSFSVLKKNIEYLNIILGV